MRQSKTRNLLILMLVLLLVSCASKLKIVEGDEVYLEDKRITKGSKITTLNFIKFDGHDIWKYYDEELYNTTHSNNWMNSEYDALDYWDRYYNYYDDSSAELINLRYIIPSGLKTIQVEIHTGTEHSPKNDSNHPDNKYIQWLRWQTFKFDVITHPQETYKAVANIENKKATVWIVNSSGEKVSGSITKILLNYEPYIDSNYYYQYFSTPPAVLRNNNIYW